jgi:hypothetical protein
MMTAITSSKWTNPPTVVPEMSPRAHNRKRTIAMVNNMDWISWLDVTSDIRYHYRDQACTRIIPGSVRRGTLAIADDPLGPEPGWHH